VVENRRAWRELVCHGETGYLCDNADEVAYYTARLAYDEEHRLAIAQQARRALVEELAEPERLWRQWLDAFRRSRDR